MSVALIDHLSFGVRDLVRACAFYDAALAPLGLARLHTFEPEGPEHPWRSAGYGPAGTAAGAESIEAAQFWLEERPGATVAGAGFHLCFHADSRAKVHAFHAAGLAAGGTDNGAPGPRPHYDPPGYYAAFLTDPDGWQIEAVTFSAT